MTKEEIAGILEQIAALLELKGENPFKIRAYVNAARAIETFGGNIPDLQDEEAVAKIPGIGKSIALKIKELAGTGSLKYLEDLRAQFPEAILELFSISGLGAKKIKALYDQLRVSSIEELRQACEAGRVAELPGFGETTQAKICKAVEERTRHAGYFQFGQIAHEAEMLRNDLAGHPEALQVEIAGSYRRRKEIVHDLDLLVATKKPEASTIDVVSNIRQNLPKMQTVLPDDIKVSFELDQSPYVTSSVRGVVPITRVDGQPVASGKPGPITQRVMALYDQKTRGR